MKRVLVVGGGIGGVEAAIRLRKKGFYVKLISNRDYLYIYPLSIWIPTREAKFGDVTIPLDKIAKGHKFQYEVSPVKSISSQEVVLENMKRYEKGRDFDYLVVALGQDKMKPKGVEYTYSICGSPEETLKYGMLLERLVDTKKSGKLAFGFGGNPKAKEAVRGGPVFEEIFNVDTMLRRKKIRDRFELTFFAPMEKPGARLGEKAFKMLDYMFQKRGIKKVVGKKIKEFTPNGVIFQDGTQIESDLTLFTPAGTGLSLLKESDFPLNEAGFIVINKYNQVEGLDHVYALGDCVALEGPEWKAKQGHLAEVMADNIAHNIALKEGIAKGKPKSYLEHLNIMCLMDTGDGGAFAYRDNEKAILIPLPIIGHWMKKAWGVYYKLYKTGKIPKLV